MIRNRLFIFGMFFIFFLMSIPMSLRAMDLCEILRSGNGEIGSI